MSSNFTAEQIKIQNIQKMGKELGEVYSELSQQVIWLNMKWQEYVELFGLKPSRIELMNKAAPEFFYVVEKSMWESILLHITRLTDSPITGQKKNLSIGQFLKLIKDKALIANLKQKIDLAILKTQFARDWRNRIIAHSDFELAMNKSAKPLEIASRNKVKEAIESICEVLNDVSSNLMDSTTGYDYLLTAGGATSLLYFVNKGLRADDEMRKRMESGKYDNSDIKFEDI